MIIEISVHALAERMEACRPCRVLESCFDGCMFHHWSILKTPNGGATNVLITLSLLHAVIIYPKLSCWFHLQELNPFHKVNPTIRFLDVNRFLYDEKFYECFFKSFKCVIRKYIFPGTEQSLHLGIINWDEFDY